MTSKAIDGFFKKYYLGKYVKDFHPSKNIRLFKSDFFESFSYIHPWSPALVFIPLISFFLFYVSTIPWLVRLEAFLGGVLVWTLAEYFIHRFFYHSEFKNPILKRIIYITHIVHHDDPEDARRLVIPPILSIPLSAVFYLMFYGALFLMMGEDGATLMVPAVYAGFMSGYLCYDYIHYMTHFKTPKTFIGKFLKQYHMVHHFVTPNEKFGVSSPLWDLILGFTHSAPPPRQKGRKAAS